MAIGGGAVGWIMGHGLNWLASPIIERRTGVSIGFFDFAPSVDLYQLLGGVADIQWMNRLVRIAADPVAADPGRDRRFSSRPGSLPHRRRRFAGQVRGAVGEVARPDSNPSARSAFTPLCGDVV